MDWDIPRIYPLIGLVAGYVIVMLLNPIRLVFRDGSRCINRYKRIWITFTLLGLAYSIFPFVNFTPLAPAALDFTHGLTPNSWTWPAFIEIWREVPLPALEGVAGIFDNATTTY